MYSTIDGAKACAKEIHRLIGTGRTQDMLKSIGRPTLLVCDIPMTQLSSYTLERFAGLIWEYLFCSLVPEMECEVMRPWSGTALSLNTDLSAEHIVGHYHPKKIYSPL